MPAVVIVQLPVKVDSSIVSVPVTCADKVNEQSAIHNRIAVHTFFVIFIEIRFYIVLIAAKIGVFFD